MKDAYIPHYDVKSLILKETFKMLLVRNPESITVAELESAIGFTRGSIFYHMKIRRRLSSWQCPLTFVLPSIRTSRLTPYILRP